MPWHFQSTTAVSEFTLDFGCRPELDRWLESSPVSVPVPVQVTTQVGVVLKAVAKVIAEHWPDAIVQVPLTSLSASVARYGPKHVVVFSTQAVQSYVPGAA